MCERAQICTQNQHLFVSVTEEKKINMDLFLFVSYFIPSYSISYKFVIASLDSSVCYSIIYCLFWCYCCCRRFFLLLCVYLTYSQCWLSKYSTVATFVLETWIKYMHNHQSTTSHFISVYISCVQLKHIQANTKCEALISTQSCKPIHIDKYVFGMLLSNLLICAACLTNTFKSLFHFTQLRVYRIARMFTETDCSIKVSSHDWNYQLYARSNVSFLYLKDHFFFQFWHWSIKMNKNKLWMWSLHAFSMKNQTIEKLSFIDALGMYASFDCCVRVLWAY